MQQLRHWSNQCTPDGVRPSPVSGVFESDCVLRSEALRETLLEALKPLEEVPEGELDWHPGSDKQVRLRSLSSSSRSKYAFALKCSLRNYCVQVLDLVPAPCTLLAIPR